MFGGKKFRVIFTLIYYVAMLIAGVILFFMGYSEYQKGNSAYLVFVGIAIACGAINILLYFANDQDEIPEDKAKWPKYIYLIPSNLLLVIGLFILNGSGMHQFASIVMLALLFSNTFFALLYFIDPLKENIPIIYIILASLSPGIGFGLSYLLCSFLPLNVVLAIAICAWMLIGIPTAFSYSMFCLIFSEIIALLVTIILLFYACPGGMSPLDFASSKISYIIYAPFLIITLEVLTFIEWSAHDETGKFWMVMFGVSAVAAIAIQIGIGYSVLWGLIALGVYILAVIIVGAVTLPRSYGNHGGSYSPSSSSSGRSSGSSSSSGTDYSLPDASDYARNLESFLFNKMGYSDSVSVSYSTSSSTLTLRVNIKASNSDSYNYWSYHGESDCRSYVNSHRCRGYSYISVNLSVYKS